MVMPGFLKQILINLAIFAVVLFIGFLAFVQYLRMADPLGIQLYHQDWLTFRRHIEEDPTGYRIDSGFLDMESYDANILDTGFRNVPDTNPDASCSIAAIGDSMTFGIGVNDDETWVNLLAQEFPDVHFTNTGHPGFSAGNIYAVYQSLDADAYIWFIIDNDVMPAISFGRAPEEKTLSGILDLYYQGIRQQYSFENTTEEELENADYDTYWSTLEALTTQENILLIGYDRWQHTFDTLEQYPGLMVIPYTDNRNSWYDSHPDAEGHRAIFESIRDAVENLITTACGS